jgi:hypothetical protein
MKIRTALTLVALLSLCSLQDVLAASLPGVEALAKLPNDVFDPAFAAPVPRGGLVGHNSETWVGPWLQRTAMVPIQGGAIRGNAALVERYWPAITATLAHERSDGSFDYASEANDVATDPVDGAKMDTATSNAFWLAESEEALLLLRSSSIASGYGARIDGLVPQFQSALDWLARPEHLADMEHYDGIATNRLLEDTKALLLGDQLAHVPQARAAGEALLSRSLALQTPDGYFPEHGGADSSYNAVSCMKIGEIALFVEDPRLRPALTRCADWELSRVEDSGHVSEAGNTRTGLNHQTIEGRPYAVNYPEVIRMFAVAGALLGDRRYIDAAERISSYRAAHPSG